MPTVGFSRHGLWCLVFMSRPENLKAVGSPCCAARLAGTRAALTFWPGDCLEVATTAPSVPCLDDVASFEYGK